MNWVTSSGFQRIDSLKIRKAFSMHLGIWTSYPFPSLPQPGTSILEMNMRVLLYRSGNSIRQSGRHNAQHTTSIDNIAL